MNIAASQIYIDGKALGTIFAEAQKMFQNEDTKGAAMKMVADALLNFQTLVNKEILSAEVRVNTLDGKVETKNWIEYTKTFKFIDEVDDLNVAEMYVNNFNKIVDAEPGLVNTYVEFFTISKKEEGWEVQTLKTLTPELAATKRKINELSKSFEDFNSALKVLKTYKVQTEKMIKVALKYDCPFIKEANGLVSTTDDWNKLRDSTFGDASKFKQAIQDGDLEKLAREAAKLVEKSVNSNRFAPVVKEAVNDRLQAVYLALYCINRTCARKTDCTPKDDRVALVLNIAYAVCTKKEACKTAFEAQYQIITDAIKTMATASNGCAFLKEDFTFTPIGQLLVETFGGLPLLKKTLEASNTSEEAYQDVYKLLTNKSDEPNSNLFKDRLAAVSLAMFCTTQTCKKPAKCSSSFLNKTAVLFCEKTGLCDAAQESSS